jgi:MoaD family protein
LKVRVQYFAAVREITNQREEMLDVDSGTSVLDLLKLLVARHGSRLREYVFDSKTGNPRTYLQFLLDEESIATMNGFSTMLRDNSVLAIIPPVGGG